MPVIALDHPLAAHLLTRLRDRDTDPATFRAATRRITSLLAIEATRTLDTITSTIQTPLEPFDGSTVEPVVAVPILRAGLGMLDAFVELLPDVAVGYVGLERDEATAVASSYYAKLPPNIAGKRTFILDPMLATGGSAAHAVSVVKNAGAGPTTMVCVVSAPEGIARLEAAHPEILIVTAAIDRELNSRKYILPGLGDFGDRLYGTVP